ncbi:MAG: tetratricopeptide repeat protein [Caldilineaceae bacterium]
MNLSTVSPQLTFHTIRRPGRMLIVALLILAAAMTWRTWQSMRNSDAIDTLKLEQPTAVDLVARFQQRLATNPDDEIAYAQLGLALLQQVRENGDVSLYVRAGQAFEESLKRDPQQIDALVGQGVLALALHDFAGALEWGKQAQAVNPWRAETVGILVDGNVELGHYAEAVAAAQQMVNLRPGLESYSRVSYMRELHGDVDGAIAAMQLAVEAAVPGTESRLWTQVQLGHLYFNRGDLDTAQAVYQAALAQRPDYIHAQAGLARIQAARGDYANAIAAYEQITQRLPLPEYIVALGDLYEVTDHSEKAAEQRALVHVIQQLNASAGMNVDLELAYFDVEYGDDPAAALAEVQAAYAERPTIYAADALAWALYKNGRFEEAQEYSAQALRLGMQDATLHYHAGMIAQALGHHKTAQAHLAKAREINPYFSIRHQNELNR